MPFKEVVMGVAILGNKMFVVFNRSPAIHVYDNSDMQLELETLYIPNMEWPHQIIACAKTQKLFIADMQNSEAGCLWRLSTDGDFAKHLPSPQEPEPIWPRSVAAASDGRLVVVSCPNILRMYAVRGRCLCRVELPHDMEVQHAVITNRNTFLVALSRAENTLVLLREVDLDGNDVRHCPVEFKLPMHFVCCPVGHYYQGHVVVADREDESVILLDDRLKLKQVLLHCGELDKPRRLLLLPENGLLYICGSSRATSSYVSLWEWSSVGGRSNPFPLHELGRSLPWALMTAVSGLGEL